MNKKQLFISMTAQIVSFAVSMGVSFILSPYLAKAIDISASGFVTQGNQFVSYAQILVSALNTMASRFITVSIHQGKEEEANLELKNAVIAELEKLVAEPTDKLLQAVRDLQARWGEIGHVPFRKKEKIYRRYRELCDKIYDSLHESAGRRRMDSFRKNVAEKGGTELTRERTRLQNAFDAKKQEIQTYETNLSFFRTSSKKGNSLMADIEKKVERLKEDLEMLTQKIKEVNKQIQAEAENK